MAEIQRPQVALSLFWTVCYNKKSDCIVIDKQGAVVGALLQHTPGVKINDNMLCAIDTRSSGKYSTLSN